MTAVHVDENIDRGGQDISLIIECVEQEQVRACAHSAKQVQAVPDLVRTQVVFRVRLRRNNFFLQLQSLNLIILFWPLESKQDDSV